MFLLRLFYILKTIRIGKNKIFIGYYSDCYDGVIEHMITFCCIFIEWQTPLTEKYIEKVNKKMFKIGDKARVKPKEFFDNLNNGDYPIYKDSISIQPEMIMFFGEIVTLHSEGLYKNHFFVKENKWSWADWMLEKIKNKK